MFRKHEGSDLLAGVLISVGLSACGSGAGPISDGLQSGDSRVIWENKPLTIQSLGQITASQLTLTLETTIVPPTVSGTLLQADDIFISGANAYVSYNIAGNTKLGGIDQLNMTLPFFPVRTASTTFTDTAVNGVYVSGSNVYLSGATTSTTAGPAVLEQLSLGIGSFSAVQQTFTPTSYAGTGVTYWNNSIYTLSGDTGGVTVVSPTTMAQTAAISIADARGLGYYGPSNLYVVAGQPGRVLSYNTSNTLVRTVNLGGNSIAESKSTVQVGQTMVMASLGDGGAAVICQADGHTLATIAAPTVSGLAANLTVTNAVAAGPGLLFAADGEAGVYVYLMTTGFPAFGNACNSVSLNLLGSISLGSTTYSANNVKYANGNLYVATGLGGFKVINVALGIPILGGLLDF